MTVRILLLNGPNLNLLGRRDPAIYGSATLDEVEEQCRAHAARLGHTLEARQSNHEGGLIDILHRSRGEVEGVVFNPGAYSHTSYALHDALEAIEIPTVEVHISDVRSRETWRRISVTEPACVYQIFGRGTVGYQNAISHLHYRKNHPPLTLSYGPHPDQVADLRTPWGAGPHPIAVLIHGGGWTAPYTRDLMDGMAVELSKHGMATWNIEYRRIPPVGDWRNTLADTSLSLEALKALPPEHRVDLNRTTVIGHSAGAQLGFFAAKSASPRPVRLVSVAGMLDLERLGSGFDYLLQGFLCEEREARQAEVDPVQSLPLGSPIVAIHGRKDDSVPIDQSRRLVEAARRAGDQADLVETDSDHMDIISPLSPAWEQIMQACL